MSNISNKKLVNSANDTILKIENTLHSLNQAKSKLGNFVKTASNLANHIRNLDDNALVLALGEVSHRFLSRSYFPCEVERAIDPAENAINATEKNIRAFEEILNSLQTQLKQMTSKKSLISRCFSPNPKHDLSRTLDDGQYALKWATNDLNPHLTNAFAAYKKYVSSTAEYFKFNLGDQLVGSTADSASSSKTQL